MNNSAQVIRQYADDTNLSIRIKLHAKHSTNPQGFVPWLFDHYAFSSNCNILELGCGNGSQWEGRIGHLPDGSRIILSDFSDGMVDIVSRKYSEHNQVTFQQADIQNLPYASNTFDVVIANHMLYHIPDLSKALSEVKRVLKAGGTFYSTTNGTGGMQSYLHQAIKKLHPTTKAFIQGYSFNLQNGQELLSQYFLHTARFDYNDSLAVTDTQDLIDWIKSTVTLAELTEQDLDGLFLYFEDIRKKDGVIHIPKESGLFVSIK